MLRKIRILSILTCILATNRAEALMVWYLPTAAGLIPSVLAGPNVDGGFIQAKLAKIETSDGHFDFSSVASEVTKARNANKKYEIDVIIGWTVPTWVYNEGAQPFNWIWNQSTWGPRVCSTAKAPIFWDPIWGARLKTFLSKLAGQYASDPLFYAIKLNGINANSDETILPRYDTPTSINGGQCKSNDDVAKWQAAGYSTAQVQTSFQSLANEYDNDFPNQHLDLMIVPSGFPLDGENGHAWGSIEDAMINYGINHLHAPFKVQDNSWTDGWGLVAKAGDTPISIWQTGGALKGGFPAAANLAVATTAVKEVEVSESDLRAASNLSSLALLHSTKH